MATGKKNLLAAVDLLPLDDLQREAARRAVDRVDDSTAEQLAEDLQAFYKRLPSLGRRLRAAVRRTAPTEATPAVLETKSVSAEQHDLVGTGGDHERRLRMLAELTTSEDAYRRVITSLASILANSDPIASELAKDSRYAAEILREVHTAALEATFTVQAKVTRVTLDVNAAIKGVSGAMGRVLGDRITILTDLDPSIRPAKADVLDFQRLCLRLAEDVRDKLTVGGYLEIRTWRGEPEEFWQHHHRDTRYEGLRGCVFLAFKATPKAEPSRFREFVWRFSRKFHGAWRKPPVKSHRREFEPPETLGVMQYTTVVVDTPPGEVLRLLIPESAEPETVSDKAAR